MDGGAAEEVASARGAAERSDRMCQGRGECYAVPARQSVRGGVMLCSGFYTTAHATTHRTE